MNLTKKSFRFKTRMLLCDELLCKHTCHRFEHREENRKDCLRTLYGLIEEAAKANKIAEDIRTAYVKQRLQANPAFMQKLQAKIIRSKESNHINA